MCSGFLGRNQIFLLDKNVLLLVGIFLLDVWTPVSLPLWILYFVPLIFIRAGAFRHYPLMLAGACSVLIFAAFPLSPQDASGSSTLNHRALGVIAIWVAAILIERRRETPSE